MRKLRMGLIAVGAFVIAGITAPAPAIAQGSPEKVVICHTPGHRNDSLQIQGFCGRGESAPSNNKVIEIEVSTAACRAHLGGPCFEGS